MNLAKLSPLALTSGIVTIGAISYVLARVLLPEPTSALIPSPALENLTRVPQVQTAPAAAPARPAAFDREAAIATLLDGEPVELQEQGRAFLEAMTDAELQEGLDDLAAMKAQQ